jgi:DNA-binding response OmpR family regulator
MARILIGDDDASLAVAHAVRTAGHTRLPAPTGHGAVLAARAHPDVILLDLGLPDLPGDEVLRRLKRDPATAPIPVVVVSAEPDAADRVPRGGTPGARRDLGAPERVARPSAGQVLSLPARVPHGEPLVGLG